MNFWGHCFVNHKSVERICLACGYVTDRGLNEKQTMRWIKREEGCELHCGGEWHKYKRIDEHWTCPHGFVTGFFKVPGKPWLIEHRSCGICMEEISERIDRANQQQTDG